MKILLSEEFEAFWSNRPDSFFKRDECQDLAYKGGRLRIWTDIRLLEQAAVGELPQFIENAMRECNGNVSIYRPNISDPLTVRVSAGEYWITVAVTYVDLTNTLANWQQHVRRVRLLAFGRGWLQRP